MSTDFREWSGFAKRNKWTFTVLLCVTLFCGLLIGSVLPGRGATPKAVKETPTLLAVPDPVHLSGAFASIIRSVEPAVVNISTTQVHRAVNRPQSPRGFPDPFGDFGRFF